MAKRHYACLVVLIGLLVSPMRSLGQDTSATASALPQVDGRVVHALAITDGTCATVARRDPPVVDPNADPDLDFLTNYEEYLEGTDPNNSDTDGGGENDGSEVAMGQDALDPSDDEIEAPEAFQAVPRYRAVSLTYDVKAEYTKMELWRASSPRGSWVLRRAALPLGGAYEDPAVDDAVICYRLIAQDAGGHRSAVIDSGPVTPRTGRLNYLPLVVWRR